MQSSYLVIPRCEIEQIVQICETTPNNPAKMKAAMQYFSVVTKGFLESDHTPNTGYNKIILAVANHYGRTIEELKSKSRKKVTREPRQVAMYFLKKFTSLSLAEIGLRFFKDHATVIHSIKVINGQVEYDRIFKERVNQIEKEVLEIVEM